MDDDSVHQGSELSARYAEVRPKYERLTYRLRRLLEDLLNDVGVGYGLESRTKEINRFTEKATRAGKEYTDPLTEISDLAGVRVIVQSLGDVDIVVQILRTEFEIDEARSLDKSIQLQVDQFGYQAQHYIPQDKRAANRAA